MSLATRITGWVRLSRQKNVSRWKNWRPQTEEAAQRLKQARDGIAEVDRRMRQ